MRNLIPARFRNSGPQQTAIGRTVRLLSPYFVLTSHLCCVLVMQWKERREEERYQRSVQQLDHRLIRHQVWYVFAFPINFQVFVGYTTYAMLLGRISTGDSFHLIQDHTSLQ